MLNNKIKIDLHIHSQSSEYKDGSIVNNSNIDNIEILIGKLEEYQINLFSITDHNRFDYNLYQKLKERIKDSIIVKHILPGIEFDVQFESELEKCHIITIFDDSDEDKLSKIWVNIEKIKILNNKEDYYTLKEFEDILREINLKTCLIVHQKQGFEGSKGKTQSLSESTSDPSYFMKIGYIDSLEYNYPRTEGIVKKTLRDLDVDFPLITGSDCHQWEAYPYRELTKSINRDFTLFKALPTFKGLALSLTSFSSRANRNLNENESYIKSFNMGDITIPLANGLNVIIGDNGSGKSLLANLLSGEKVEQYYNKIIKENELTVERSDSLIQDQIKYIRQGEIVEKVREGKLFDNSNTDYYEDINSVNEFRTNITNYFDNLINYVKFNISIKNAYVKLLQANVEIKNTSGLNFNPVIDPTIEISNNAPFKARVDQITFLIESLRAEYENNKEFYIEEKVDININNALRELNELLAILEIKYIGLEKLKKAKQIITKKLSDYDRELNSKRTSEEAERASTQQKYTDFKTTFLQYIMKKKEKNDFPSFPKPIPGHSLKSINSYNFEKTTNYHQVDIEENFYKALFNSGFQSKELIMKIETKDEMSSALKGLNFDQLSEFKESKLEKFIQFYCEETTTISEIKENGEIGNTPGEISLVYYKFITSTETDQFSIIIIDQPEDDINPKRINNFLLNYLSTIRDKKQVILVTHNPMLVVNLDVDNVVFVNKENNIINVKFGCLEYDSIYDSSSKNNDYSILDLVKDNLDGGYKVIERRLKSYERD